MNCTGSLQNEERLRQADGERHSDSETDRLEERETETETGRQTDSETDRLRERETEHCRETD